MIVRPKVNWLRKLLSWRGSVLRTVSPQLSVVLAVSIFVSVTQGRIFGWRVPLTVTPFTLLGVSLAIFLGFRNSASYERYWEGRKLWGARGTDPAADLARLLSPEEQREIVQARFRPAMILVLLGRWLEARRCEGACSEIVATVFDQNLGHVADVLGGCERIAGTPLPYPYAIMIHRTVYIYCFLLPFGLVDTIGPMTPLIAVLAAYTFMALEALADELEEPFGIQANDLPLDSLAQTIEDSMGEMIGVAPSRPPVVAKDYVLT